MSREIKFRVWDKRYYEMIYDGHEKPKLHKEDKEDADFLYDDDEWWPTWELQALNAIAEMQKKYSDRLYFMQYTGLKDKKGKEIYEGDIINWEYGKRYPGTVDAVVYQGYGYNPFIKSIGFDMECLGHHLLNGTAECEVIGNIYENPELLKEN